MNVKINVPNAVQKIFSVLKEYGAEAYIVGGCVRDSILGRIPHDWDICTPVLASELQDIFEEKGYKVIPTGLQHGTITLVIEGEGYEVTQFRRDGEYTDGRHPDNIEFTSNLEEDLKRRDFTINAMAYNPNAGLIDPFGGLRDIEYKMITCVSSAKDRFEEDALRILRAIRFASQLDFSIEPETDWEIHQQFERLRNISIERISSEFCKIVESNGFSDQLVLYNDVFSAFIPELKDTFGFKQNNPYHCYDVFGHTVIAVENCDSIELVTKLAVFFHDFGKPHSYQDGEDGIRHFKGHSKVSAEITDAIMRRLRFDNETRCNVVELIYYHDANFGLGEKYIKRWLNKIGENQFRRLLEVRKADIKAHNPIFLKDRIEKVKVIENLLEKVISEEECFSLNDLAINGKDVMKSMMIEEGKAVGIWLNKILNLVIDGELKNTREDLICYMTGVLYGRLKDEE